MARLWEQVWYFIVTAVIVVVGGALALVFLLLNGVARMRKLLVVIAVLLMAAGASVGVGFWQYYRQVDLGERQVSIVIKKGDGFSSVAATLADKGVVPSALALKIPARLGGIDKKLVPGRYDFMGKNSAASVLERLAEGDFVRIKVTVPEGSPIWRVAGILAQSLELDSTAIVALNRDSSFLAEIGKPCLEGYLYPETYYFPWGLNEREAVQTMVEFFDQQTDGLWRNDLPLGLTQHEVVVLASIIESETPLPRERPMVASVYLNRLREGWRLDADPTVIYGLGGLDRPLYLRDLRKDSPYNTYMRKGLPPTAINSPGLASIKAALDPAESEYFFFVADNNGGHYFSKTNAEHERARKRIKAKSSER